MELLSEWFVVAGEAPKRPEGLHIGAQGWRTNFRLFVDEKLALKREFGHPLLLFFQKVK